MTRIACPLILTLALAAASSAAAQAPAGLPKGFDGRQFVDTAGCMYQRADDGLWQPRLGRDGAPLCGYPPSLAENETVESQPAANDPLEAIANDPDIRAPEPAPPAQATADAPVAEDLAAQIALDPAIAPPAPIPAIEPPPLLTTPPAVLAEQPANMQPSSAAPRKAAQTHRGKAPTRSTQTRRDGKKRPGADAVTAPHHYVQVGAFAEAPNARRAEQRLAAMGLPVSRGRSYLKGQWLEVIMAGPFDRTSGLRAARTLLRANGYPRAFSR